MKKNSYQKSVVLLALLYPVVFLLKFIFIDSIYPYILGIVLEITMFVFALISIITKK